MGVARSARGSDRLPPSGRSGNGPPNARQVTRTAAKKTGVDTSGHDPANAQVKSRSRLAPNNSSNTTKPPLRKLAPDLPGSCDFQKAMRPPTALVATHPSAYNAAAHNGVTVKCHTPSSIFMDHDLKSRYVKTLVPTPQAGMLGPLPSAPLFSTSLIKKEPDLPKRNIPPPLFDSGVKAYPVEKTMPYCFNAPADPNHLTSMAPPDWQGKLGFLRSDTSVENWNIVSPIPMIGLPFGEMIEMADYYGPSNGRRGTK